jgi:hypothetical protein
MIRIMASPLSQCLIFSLPVWKPCDFAMTIHYRVHWRMHYICEYSWIKCQFDSRILTSFLIFNCRHPIHSFFGPFICYQSKIRAKLFKVSHKNFIPNVLSNVVIAKVVIAFLRKGLIFDLLNNPNTKGSMDNFLFFDVSSASRDLLCR